MKVGKHAIIGLLAVLIIMSHYVSVQGPVGNPYDSNTYQSNPAIFPTDQDHSPNPSASDTFEVSQDSMSGILDPISIKQSGVYVSQNKSGMIDTTYSEKTNVSIDEGNDWVASGATIDAWNLKRLYVENGTYNDGTSGWTNSTYDPDGDQTPSTDYNSTGGYVSAKNIAEETQVIQNIWTHYQYTDALWTQTVNNTPLATEFSLSLRFLYARGPLDPERDDFIEGQVYLAVFFDDSGWGRDMVTLPSRNEWYTWEVNLNPDWVGSTFVFDVGLFIAWNTVLDEDLDYDDDGSPDGMNVTEIEIYIDDVNLESVSPISFNDVEMVFNADSQSSSITEIGGLGSATIFNPSLWTQSPLAVEITSDLSVSFDYRISLDSHRYTNSSYIADPTKWGVSYVVDSGQSPELSLYTYVGTTGYVNLTLEVFHPIDWENSSILNPFLNDVTGQCTVTTGLIEIPNSLLVHLGWWKIEFESPNYCEDIFTQIYEHGSGLWTDTSIFGSGNWTRTQIHIGTVTETPIIDTPVNVTWMLPNGTIWAEQGLTGGTNGIVNGTRWTLGPLNTSAGPWKVYVEWINGTEIAHNQVSFDMYHSANLTAVYSRIDTDSGFDVTGLLYYVDADNGEYLMESSATITGNWSGSQISFVANPLQKWWQADFDTSLVGAGRFLVVVNASRPYYENVTCQFTIVSTFRTNFDITSEGPLPTEVGLHEELSVQMRYELESSTGIDGAIIQMNYTGPSDGLQYLGQDNSAPGDYSLNLTSSKSGIYTVTLTISKAYHYNKSDSFTLIVGATGTDLTILNGTADFMEMGGSYRLILRYTNSTGDGLAGADVEILSVTPSSGLLNSTGPYGGNGLYSIDLTPSVTGTYTLIIRANLTNHVTQIVAFTLTASDIVTVATIDSSGATVAVWENQSVLLTFRDEHANGISGATVTLLNQPLGLTYAYKDLTGGVYNVSFVSSVPGTYQLAFKTSKTNYLNSTVGFTLLVRGYASVLTTLNGSADFVTYGQSYTLVLRYANGTGFGITGADIEIIDQSPSTGLGYVYEPEDGLGHYYIVLTPTSANIYTLLIKANLTVYATQIVSFSLTVREISTILTLDASGATISVDQNHTAQITFRDDALNGIEGATLLVLNPPSELGFSFTNLTGGHYTLTLTSAAIGTYEFAIRATLKNYLNSTVGFTLVVRTIPTELSILEGVSSASIHFTDDYNLTLVYFRTDTDQNIGSADLTFTTLPVEGLEITVTKMGDLYFMSFSADAIGKWQVFFTANKTDHVTGFIEFEFEVLPVAIEISISRGLTGLEGTLNTFSLWLLESQTGNPVSGALVEYQLIDETGPGQIRTMEEGESGLYTTSFIMPSFDSDTVLRVYITLENYELASDYYQVTLAPLLNEVAALNRTIQEFSPFLFVMGIVVVGYAGRRSYIRRQRRQNIEAMVVKRRFDDVKSLLGVIVLHKNTGIPIYAKMLKGGLDETLVSGFVSAISTFRSEFNVDQENWTITPISDIIRTVATENLICAFISLSPPSKGQELRMVEFAEAVGFVFDTMYTEAPTHSLDDETTIQFDAFFDDILDGRFLRDYTVSEVKSFPRRTKCIEERIHRIDDEDGFDLDELATEMTSCGLEEARVYKIIMDAIEMGNLTLASFSGSKIEADSSVDEGPSIMMPDIESPSEVPMPPPESDIPDDELSHVISDEEKFLNDVEALLSEESKDEKEE